MKTNFKNLAKFLSLLMMGISVYALQACGDDEEDSITVLENGNMSVNGHEAVDLGLSVNWATCNVGAYTPEGCGDYYSWGELATKKCYDNEPDVTNKWYDAANGEYTKYNEEDGKTKLDPSDDVATVKWGKKWRIPTKREVEELCNECIWTLTTQNGMEGYLITGPSGKSIFLPAAGNRRETILEERGARGYYWTSILSDAYTTSACNLYFGDGYIDGDYYTGRYNGLPVRPVTDEMIGK